MLRTRGPEQLKRVQRRQIFDHAASGRGIVPFNILDDRVVLRVGKVARIAGHRTLLLLLLLEILGLVGDLACGKVERHGLLLCLLLYSVLLLLLLLVLEATRAR
jgi:hypothetical protein